MTALTIEPPTSARPMPRFPSSPNPARLRWTLIEFERLTEQGWFQGRRVELIDGEILEMAAQKGPHVVSVDVTGDALRVAFGPGHFVRRQAPLHLLIGSAPEPDLAVVPGDPRQHLVNPATALLVVEVSDTTLAYDLGWKASLYARAEIPEYWVVDIESRRLIVHRRPDPATGAWGEKFVVDENGGATPLARPQATIRVADMLP